MTLRHRIVVGLLCTFAVLAPVAAVTPAAAPIQLIEAIRGRLVDAPVLRGQFEQIKTVKGFRKPLRSQGDFLFVRERGVSWHTRSPFASSLTVTRERLVSRRADGRIDTELDASAEPGLRAVNEVLFALMATDLHALAAHFHAVGDAPDTGGWKLALVPIDAVTTQWLASIELEGDRFVRTVKITDAQGDDTVIRFSAHDTAPLRADEDAAFD